MRRAALVVVLGGAAVAAGSAPPAPVGELGAQPRVLFVSVLPGKFGKVGVVPLGRTDAAPAWTDLTCHRIHFAAGRGVCMLNDLSGVRPPYFAFTFDAALQPAARRMTLAGRPSRTRVSPSGRYGAMTVFTLGDAYDCDFNTRTTLLDMRTGASLGDLEKFSAWRRGKLFWAKDFNYWGVTFTRDDNRFFATLGTAGKTYLVTGDIRLRTVRVVREGVECPSLSPDGKRIAFKKRVGATEWRLHVLDLATLVDRPVAGETRSIDDQAEWLDDDHLLYGFVADTGLPEDAANIWVAGLQDTAPPRIFVRSALSPAVVR
jgi:hypothetical protein